MLENKLRSEKRKRRMPLSSGTRLGPYEILSPLGRGGMGEVYRAIDAKLERDVAIKILPEALAHDPERLARFEREAKVLASLNHPNIAAIYGLEESDAGGCSTVKPSRTRSPTCCARRLISTRCRARRRPRFAIWCGDA